MMTSPPESDYDSSEEEGDDPSPPLMEEKLKKMNRAKLKPQNLEPPLRKFKKKHLPLDIISNILSRINGIKLVDLQLTCKDWCFLTKEPYFINLHLSKTSNLPGVILFYQDEKMGQQTSNFMVLNHLFEPQFRLKRDLSPLLITPPINGLICIYNFTNNVTILNPTTREFINLPNTPLNKSKLINGYPKCYFGFDPLRKEYKIIRCFYLKMDHENEIYHMFCEIFTLGKDIYWRNIGVIKWYPAGSGINVNGFIYFLIGANNPLKDKIMAFDSNTEKFKEIYLNEVITQFEEIVDNNEVIISLAKLDGNICVILTRYFGSTLIDIWMLKDYLEHKWVHKCNIQLPSNMKDQRYKIEVISLNGDKALLRSGKIFYEYYLEKMSIKKVYDVNISGTNIKAFSFVQSLVTLGN